MSKNILIVDDDISFASNIVNNSIDNNLSFCIAGSLNQAKFFLKNYEFDIILANFKISGGNTLELKKEVSSKSTKFLFFSNFDSDYSYVKQRGEKCCYKYALRDKRGDFFESI